MMGTVKHIGLFFLLFVFLFSTTGISILHHICNSSNKDEVTVYPELFKSYGSSCCEGEEENSSAADQSGSGETEHSMHYAPMPCCINLSSFLKLDLVTLRADKLVVESYASILPQFIPAIQAPNVDEPITAPIFFFQFYSPPLFGKRLVYFLHQSKIPAHPSLS
jgi:hypothetical protein